MIYYLIAISVISIFIGVSWNAFELRKARSSKKRKNLKKIKEENQISINQDYQAEPVIIKVLDEVVEP